MKVVKIGRKTTRAELGAIICRAFAAALDDVPVLVGGSVVSIYSDERWVSDDLDFVTWSAARELAPIMEELGFARRGSWWVHLATDFLVQFVNAPVMVGGKHVRDPDQLRTRAGTLAILSPLDCVLDRLAWHLDRGDAQTLDQAVAVARARRVSLTAIERWLAGEPWPEDKKAMALEALRRRLGEPPRKPRKPVK